MEDRVFLPGQVGNVSESYRSRHLFVMCSLFEGFPNALVEARRRFPVVSFDCETARAIIRDGIDGMLIQSIGRRASNSGIRKANERCQHAGRAGLGMQQKRGSLGFTNLEAVGTIVRTMCAPFKKTIAPSLLAAPC